jgi:hypothetical protein
MMMSLPISNLRRVFKDFGTQGLLSPPFYLQITPYKPVLIWGRSVIMEAPSLMTRSGGGEEEICCLSPVTRHMEMGTKEKEGFCTFCIFSPRGAMRIFSSLALSSIFKTRFQRDKQTRIVEKIKHNTEKNAPKQQGKAQYVPCLMENSPGPLELSIV